MSFGGNDFFGGLFDFNGDGITDLGEQFIMYEIFKEVTKEDELDDYDSDDGLDDLDDLDDDLDDDFEEL